MPKSLPKPKASTQEHLDIEDITNDLVITKAGWVVMVINASSLNFDLLSEAEQDATIYAYGAFLNSLTFPLQILIRSKKADITSYFHSLEEAESAQPNPDLRRQIQKYEDFLRSIVHQKTILDKKFYLIITFSPLEMGFKGIGKKNISSGKTKAQLLSEAKASLFPKRDHIIKQMARIGLSSKQLTTKELIELFYDIYNPAPTETQRVILDTSSYTTPIVEPAVEVPIPQPQPAGEDTIGEAPAPIQQAPLAPLASSQPTINQPTPHKSQEAAPNKPPGGINAALVNLRKATGKASEFLGKQSGAQIGNVQNQYQMEQKR